MLHSIARFCFRKYRLVISVWIVALIALSAASSSIGPDWLDQGSLPGTESAKAQALLEKEVPEAASQVGGVTGTVVFKSEGDIHNYQGEIEKFLTSIRDDSNKTQVTNVISPFNDSSTGQISSDNTIAYATIVFNDDVEMQPGMGDPVVERASNLKKVIQVEFGGYPFMEVEFPLSELIGIVAAIIILLVAFGSIVAAGMPILTALVGVGIGTALITLASRIVGIPDFTTNIAAMIGIGVGIDYALFIVTRYREAMKRGVEREAAVIEAMTTAGGAVLFAGITVVISLLGMLIINLDFVSGIAIGTSLAVLIMLIAALTFVPALLASTFGRHIDKWSIHRKKKDDQPEKPPVWVKWSEFIQRRAWPAAIGGVVILVVLSIPVFSLRVGVSDSGNDPDKTTTRKAYDILAQGFGPGFNGPLFAVTDLRESSDPQALMTIVEKIENTDGVAVVVPSSAQLQKQSAQSDSGDSAESSTQTSEVIPIQVFPTTSPQSEETSNLVNELRNEQIPAAVGDSGARVYIGGLTPANVDFATVMSERILYFIAGVLVLSFLLLMCVFRSILVPVKAVIMNLLSIGASYGVLVAIFQWGWARELFGIGAPGPIEPWAPMMLFAIVFGLSMDYEVFLLSKIKEEYDDTKDNAAAVTHGLASTARVISAAALIMICVFLSFALAPDRIFKLMGLGLAVAVFLDATIVRMLLVPATMELLGDKNWWFPKWLDKIIPQIHVERVQAETNAALAEATTGSSEN